MNQTFQDLKSVTTFAPESRHYIGFQKKYYVITY